MADTGGLLSRTGFITDIQFFSLSDGPGIRTTIFLKGCLLNCRWCHNPEGKYRYPEVFPFLPRCDGCGDCIEVCPAGAITMERPGVPRIDRRLCNGCFQCVEACKREALVVWGRQVTVEEVIGEVERDKTFYRTSGGGMTLSGGEPLAQPGFAGALLQAARERGIQTALDTCGHVKWEAFEGVLENSDCVLLDIKHMDPRAHRDYCGITNELILENASRMVAMGKQVRVRVPVIPGFNDTEENLRRTAEFVRDLGRSRGSIGVDILPYHPFAGAKYRVFGLEYPYPSGEGYPEDRLRSIVEIFVDCDLEVTVGA